MLLQVRTGVAQQRETGRVRLRKSVLRERRDRLHNRVLRRAQNPIRRHNIIPLLVEELLVCCSNVRRKAMQLLLASGSAAQALADKKRLADLYRRVHDTV